MIGVALSFVVLSIGKPVMAEQSRIQFQAFYKTEDNAPLRTYLVIACDTANGNLIYMYSGKLAIGGSGGVGGQGNSVAIDVKKSQCAKTQK